MTGRAIAPHCEKRTGRQSDPFTTPYLAGPCLTVPRLTRASLAVAN